MNSAGKDWSEYRQLWGKAFGDSEKYMDYYFMNKAVRSNVCEDRENNALCSMAFFTLYDAVLQGEICRLPYIVGVATDERKRHEGRMTKVLSGGMDQMRKQGCPLVFLSPADPSIYRPLGFVSGYMRQTTIWEGGGDASLFVCPWDSLDEEQRQQAAIFAEEQLKKEAFDLHLIHHKKYYDEVNREMQALEGALLVLFEQERVVGVANWIVEEGRQEITELICRREVAKRVLGSLQAWCGGDRLTVDDSTFIDHLGESGLRRRAQEKPYLMYRFLGSGDRARLRCYVNDIT